MATNQDANNRDADGRKNGGIQNQMSEAKKQDGDVQNTIWSLKNVNKLVV